ncbi:putative clathrin coat assembly protein [Leishmania major strain Friedlin]|uniref:Putative clathrin coat assembly protein n=1 Tax=Leishmania major TaxID=5664 RepID=Q4QAX8_LEIMA|nr:putative clathrin coat assembly protein [Leishmania major strain Friedlin]CAG9574469.1 clathrin_coat_assembly_protein_-_putative [Leishmania major strain Friedlin]CAJ03889.1 putative clathrin coat assembly protein [Leishmania major strain Friedlin]|eukprot:XP_001683520.1 putative clathrin coat assembly protein [Leishmania major strain Friedlin]
MNSTDTKQSAGYFKEKATIGLSSFSGDEIVKAILKTTSHLLKAPKEKYMQKLVAASYGQYGSGLREGLPINEFIVRELEKRSHTHNWIVVLKTMVSFHRLMCDASDSMVETICYYRHVFRASNIKNLADTADGAGQAYFIAQYMTYLEERCVMQSALGKGRRVEIREFEEYLETLNAKSLQPVFEILLRLFEAVPAVEYREAVVNNFCTLEAYQLLVRDGKQLFQHLAKRVIFILDGFEDFSLPEKRRWFDLYRRYASAFASVKQYFDSMLCSSRVFLEPVPKLKPLPESLLTRLEGDIRASETAKEGLCTLESLGICSREDSRVDSKEEKIRPPRAPEPAVVNQSEAVTALTPAAPTVSLDDLFVPSQEPTKPVQPASCPASWTPAPLAATSFQQGSEQFQWETGVPQNWGSGGHITLQAIATPPVPPPQHAFSGGAPPPAGEGALYPLVQSALKQPPPPVQFKKPADPLKDLYNSCHWQSN